MNKQAVVLLSGGLDSATVLAMARADGYECYALTVDYGQRHRIELDAARRIAAALGVAEHRVVALDLTWIGGSALTDPSIAVPETRSTGVPITYVPARNTLFLALATAWAERLGVHALYIGANAVDYSGYPDCRPAFIEAFAALANVATSTGVAGTRWCVHAPLMNMDKARIIRTGVALGIDYGLTTSCYQPDAGGAACAVCDSCVIRRAGFAAAGVPDPTRYRL